MFRGMHQRRRSLWGIGLITGISALLVAMGLQLSIWPSFELERNAIRSAMRWSILRGVDPSALEMLRFTTTEYAQLRFEDEGKEVRVDGHIYDIVHTTSAAGTVIIHAVRDEAETALLADLDRRVQQAQDDQGHCHRRMLIAAWAGFHEGPVERTIAITAQLRHFPDRSVAEGRTLGSIEPGPPRKA